MTTPMPVAGDARSHPLIAQLFARHGYAEVDAATVDALADRPGRVLLLFTEDPVRVRETLDLAVVLPEIVRAFPGRFAVGVLLPEAARDVHPRFGFRRWPALVLLKDGRYVGVVDGLRGWDEYVTEVARLLDAEPSRPPAVGVAIKAAGGASSSCSG